MKKISRNLSTRSLAEDGPWFIAAKIDSVAPKGQTPREPVIIKDRFTRAMMRKPGAVSGGYGDRFSLLLVTQFEHRDQHECEGRKPG